MKKQLQLLFIAFGLFSQINAQIQFQEVLPQPPLNDFIGVSTSSVDFADIDNDNDQDVLVTGYFYSATMYRNDGNGNFTEITGTPFDLVSQGSSAFSDIDNDNDLDVLITGLNISGTPVAKLYRNDGNGNFVEITGTSLTGVAFSSVDFADIDNDNDQDLIITGINNTVRTAKLYQNDGNGNFTEIIGTPFTGVANGSVLFVDIDNDSDNDILISGINSPNRYTKLYQNDGNGNYTEIIGTPFDHVSDGSNAISDVDNDNDKDILITGNNGSDRIAKLYLNDGNGNYTLLLGTPFEGIYMSSIAFIDVNNDSYDDVLFTGINSSNQRITKLYQNNGGNNFSEVLGTPFVGSYQCDVGFTDVDNDNDQDIMIAGTDISGTRYTKLFKNISIMCQTASSTITPTVCNTYTVPSGDETYTISGTYMDTIPNVGGCDSVLTINLTINNSTIGTDVISACGSHTWIDGNFYTSSNNIATHTLTNSVGCDSVVTLNLTILSLSGNTINVTACDSYTVPSGDETYTVSGNYLDTLVNSMGCDSALLINLTVTNSTAGSENVTACNSFLWIDGNTYTASNNSSTHTLTNSVGCDSIVTLNLTINNSNSSSVNVIACDTYTWPTNATTYTASGSYTATLTNVNGCDSLATLNLTINPLPTITTSSDTLICTGKSTTLTASGATTYNWDNGAGTGASVSVSPTSTTTYIVTGTDVNGCENTASTTVTVDPCLGINENNDFEVNIYPNPSTGEFTIEVKTNCEVEIINAIGEIVFKQNLVSGTNAINISTNPNGLYFINIKTNEHYFSKRIVLNK